MDDEARGPEEDRPRQRFTLTTFSAEARRIPIRELPLHWARLLAGPLFWTPLRHADQRCSRLHAIVGPLVDRHTRRQLDRIRARLGR